MNWLNFNPKKLIIGGIMVLLPLISLNMQSRPQDNGWFDQPFSFIASQVNRILFSFVDGVRGNTHLYLNLVNIKKENRDLYEQNNTLLARLSQFEERQKENDRLHALFDFKQKSKMELVAARVMAQDIVADHRTIQIDKGTRHGLKDGQAVISINGVVGHIFKPELTTSQVLLLTDRFSVVDGIVSRTRARGIVEGEGNENCHLLYVDKTEDVAKGDLIVTSGLDNIFPKGFPVATVDSVEDKSYLVSLKVELRPVVHPDKVEEVFIIINANKVDLGETVGMSK